MPERSRTRRPLAAILVTAAVAVAGGVLLALALRKPPATKDDRRRTVRVAAAEQVTAPASVPKTPTGSVALGDTAPTLALPDLDGRRHALRQHRGRVVVLNFWASWCPPCIREMPSLQALHEKGLPDVSVVTVAADDSPSTVRGIARRMGLTFPILLDPDGRECAAWGTVKFPETWILTPDGRVVDRLIGEQDWTDPTLIERLRSLAGVTGAADPG